MNAHAPDPAPSESPSRVSLGEAFQELLDKSAGNGISLADAMHVLRERGMAVVMLIVAIPFLIPVPTTFGLSTPAGLGIMLLGLYITLGREAKLPAWMGRRRLTQGTLERVVWFAKKYERLVKPRLQFMTWPGINRLLGISIIFAGFTLGLPGPNFIPAIACVCLLIGVIERDGLFVIVGQIVNVLLAAFLLFLVYLVIAYGFVGAKSMVEGWLGKEMTPATAPASMPATTQATDDAR